MVYASCLTSGRTDLRKLGNNSLVPSLLAKIKVLLILEENYGKIKLLNFSHCALFHMKTRVLYILWIIVVYVNIVNNGYQEYSRTLYAFVTDKSFGQLLDISLRIFIILKYCAWLFDQNFKPLEIEDKINITLVINQSAKYKKWCVI